MYQLIRIHNSSTGELSVLLFACSFSIGSVVELLGPVMMLDTWAMFIPLPCHVLPSAKYTCVCGHPFLCGWCGVCVCTTGVSVWYQSCATVLVVSARVEVDLGITLEADCARVYVCVCFSCYWCYQTGLQRDTATS